MSETPTTTPRWPAEPALLEALGAWMAQRRWYPLSGTTAPAPTLVSCQELAPEVRVLVLAVPRRGGQPPVLLHVPVVLDLPEVLESPEAPVAGAGVLVDSAGSQVAVVDGPHHPAYWRAWARAAEEAGTTLGPSGARAVAERAEGLRVLTGEQSNTSVVLSAPPRGDDLGEDVIVKVLRVLAPGRNPDVEVPVALARQGWDQVPRPVAWSTLTWTDPSTGQEVTADAAVACTFIPGAQDGFELFCRLAAQDDSEGPVRTRSLDLARRLGETTATMHAHLARALGTCEPSEPAELAEALEGRAAWALAEVPNLTRVLPGLPGAIERALGELAALERLEPATRVHGDLHLGQVLLRSGDPEQWYVVDFEGEPLRPLAERREPDQPLRDVAGMLRSFDYAAAVGPARDEGWLPAVRAAFLEGYRRATSPGSAQDEHAVVVLRSCLELDKVLYEAVYEARHRPGWIEIPVRGLRALLSPADPS